jgi:predicted nuclease with TOPRIM domain
VSNYNLNLDEDVHEALRNRDESIVDALNEAARQYLDLASMDTEAGLRRRLDDIDQRLEEWQERRLVADEKIDELEAERDVIVEQLETLEEESNSWEEDLDAVLDEMQDGNKNMFAEHPRVDDVARAHDEQPESVLDALQERADERGLDMESSRFQQVKAQNVAQRGDV